MGAVASPPYLPSRPRGKLSRRSSLDKHLSVYYCLSTTLSLLFTSESDRQHMLYKKRIPSRLRQWLLLLGHTNCPTALMPKPSQASSTLPVISKDLDYTPGHAFKSVQDYGWLARWLVHYGHTQKAHYHSGVHELHGGAFWILVGLLWCRRYRQERPEHYL